MEMDSNTVSTPMKLVTPDIVRVEVVVETMGVVLYGGKPVWRSTVYEVKGEERHRQVSFNKEQADAAGSPISLDEAHRLVVACAEKKYTQGLLWIAVT